jgi:simple sugar transport system permease protein
MGLFNIGVEGQYRMAAIIAAALGAAVTLPAPLHVAFIIIVAMVVGAAFSSIAGILKVTRNVNEVLSTLMLNGIVGGLLGILLKWKTISHVVNSMRRTKDLPKSAWIPDLNRVLNAVGFHLPKGTALYGSVVLAIAVGVAFSMLVNRTRFGFDLRSSGINPEAARAAGVNPKAMVLATMVLSGALAGLVGIPTLLSDSHKFTQEFPIGYGFAGIACALVGRQKVGGIAVAALLFAFIERTALILPRPPLKAPKEIGTIMQGTMILSAVIAYEVVRRIGEASAVREAAAKTAGAELAATAGTGATA